MLDTACAENPNIVGQVIGVPADAAAGELGQILADEARPPLRATGAPPGWQAMDSHLVRADAASRERVAPPWRASGVYLVTGGMGGLGPGGGIATSLAMLRARP